MFWRPNGNPKTLFPRPFARLHWLYLFVITEIAVQRFSFHHIWPFAALILLLLIVSLVELNQAPTQYGTCEGSCTMQLDGQSVTLSFGRYPVQTEEMINVSLNYPVHWQLAEAWVQGVNMYMGKTPLVLAKGPLVAGETHGQIFLGACSEPRMQWQLVARFLGLDGQTHMGFFRFSTRA